MQNLKGPEAYIMKLNSIRHSMTLLNCKTLQGYYSVSLLSAAGTSQAGWQGTWDSIPSRCMYYSHVHSMKQWLPLESLINWYQGSLPRDKAARGKKLNIHPPASAQVKNLWRYTFTPLYIMAWCWIKHKDSLTLTLLTIYDTKEICECVTCSYIYIS